MGYHTCLRSFWAWFVYLCYILFLTYFFFWITFCEFGASTCGRPFYSGGSLSDLLSHPTIALVILCSCVFIVLFGCLYLPSSLFYSFVSRRWGPTAGRQLDPLGGGAPLPECVFTCVLLEFLLLYHFDPVLLCVCASTSDWLVFMYLPLRLLVSCPLLVSLSPDYPVYPLHTVWFQLSCLLHVEPTCFS